MSSKESEVRQLTTTEGFLCGALAACIAVCTVGVVERNNDVDPTFLAGHCVQSGRSYQDSLTAAG